MLFFEKKNLFKKIYNFNLKSTIGAEFGTKQLEIDGFKVKLIIFDT